MTFDISHFPSHDNAEDVSYTCLSSYDFRTSIGYCFGVQFDRFCPESSDFVHLVQ